MRAEVSGVKFQLSSGKFAKLLFERARPVASGKFNYLREQQSSPAIVAAL
jgi:hypothetical protein